MAHWLDFLCHELQACHSNQKKVLVLGFTEADVLTIPSDFHTTNHRTLHVILLSHNPFMLEECNCCIKSSAIITIVTLTHNMATQTSTDATSSDTFQLQRRTTHHYVSEGWEIKSFWNPSHDKPLLRCKHFTETRKRVLEAADGPRAAIVSLKVHIPPPQTAWVMCETCRSKTNPALHEPQRRQCLSSNGTLTFGCLDEIYESHVDHK